MSSDRDGIQNRLIEIGLDDPFIKMIAGLVAVATIASTVISLLGDGMKAVLAIGLSIVFGVILVLMRVLIKNTDGVFVRLLCYLVSGTVAAVFAMLIIFAVPAVVICWPQPYHDTLGLKACSSPAGPPSEPVQAFTPVAFVGPGIVADPANARFTLMVFYRTSRQRDAERVVGAFLSAGYASRGLESTLNEVATDDHSPNASLVKTTPAAQDLAPEVLRILKLSIPVLAERIRVDPQPIPLSRGDVQVDLF